VRDEWEPAVRDPFRLGALAHSGLIGMGAEDEFDRLIELAVKLTGVGRGLITLVDGETTTAMSSVGFPGGLALIAPVELSFCRFMVSSGRPLVVEDARTDPLTSGDPAIDLFVAVSVASYPIEDADGFVFGTFCVMDSLPHEWTATDLQVLATLAKSASTEIARRRSDARLLTVHQGEASAF
jgi:sigma-B regulation protein RsbU (phosphoserine phosphatase)